MVHGLEHLERERLDAPVVTYPILVGTLAASANYALTFTPSKLTITEPPPPTQTSTAQHET